MSENRVSFVIVRILILLLFFTINSTAKNNPTASCPSSCGNIRNVTSPFRLKGDPGNCGNQNTFVELDCQSNQAVLSAGSKRYYVKEINYDSRTIRVVDPGIIQGDLSSCPLNSFGFYDLTVSNRRHLSADLKEFVAFVHCPTPVSSVKYVKAAFCGNRRSTFSSSSEIYSYVMFGQILGVSDLEESCVVDRVIPVSGGRCNWDNSSLASIYDCLTYGFEFDWGHEYCHRAVPLSERWFFCQADAAYEACGDRCYYLIAWVATVFRFPHLLVAALAALRFVIVFPLLVWLVVYKWRRRHLSMDETIEEFLKGQNNLTPIKYTYSEIKKMTNNFNQKLGEGGYGTVYKGKLRSGPQVAIKMMEQSTSEQEFISEVGTIGRIHHVNVVQLIGFCIEGSKCALVYDFLSNGSLDRYIFSQESLGTLALKYDKMFEIALGVARGIDYLHRGCDMQILHFDIKPHNILLDENFNPKISDFGLARLYPTDESAINLTAARGTLGYMAPEMFYKNIGGVSYKADIYSFGMLLMEMAGRKKNMNPFTENVSQIYFPSWVYAQLVTGKDIEIEDATEEEKKMIKKLIIVALWCIQMKPSDRPPMNKVVEMLEGDSEVQMPPKPFLAPREITENHGICETYSVDYVSLDSPDN